MENSKPKRKGLKLFLVFFIPVFIGLAVLFGYMWFVGAIDPMDYFCGVTLDPWPAYDPDYRLDMQEEQLTEEQAAQFIATKIPDEYKAGLEKIRLVAQYECVQLGPGPDYSEELNANGYPVDPPYYARPYKNSVVLAEGFIGLEIKILYESSEGDLAGQPVINAIRDGFAASSDYDLVEIRGDGADAFKCVLNGNGTAGTSGGGNEKHLVQKSDYERFYPNYTVQPAG